MFRFRDNYLCDFAKSRNFKICDVLFLLNPKYHQSEILSNTRVLITNIFNMVLVQRWILETSLWPFYDFNEMKI